MKLFYIILLMIFYLPAMVIAQEHKRIMQDTLKEVTVTDGKVQRILESGKEYVVDYAFVDNDILVATYRAGNPKNSRLFLLGNYGDTLAITKLPESPVSLYKSCVGVYYCVGVNKFYPILFESKKITVGPSRPIQLLYAMQQCEYSQHDTFYYRINNNDHFAVMYGWERLGDTIIHPIKADYDYRTDVCNVMDLAKIQALLSGGHVSEAAKVDGVRQLINRGMLLYQNAQLFVQGDNIVIFNLRQKKAEYYTLQGKPVKEQALAFDWVNVEHLRILQDDVTEKFYLYRHENATRHTVEELNMESGQPITKQTIERPFVESVKVHNGNVYFLWQDTHNAVTRQLFVQN